MIYLQCTTIGPPSLDLDEVTRLWNSTSSSGSGVPWSGHVVKWYCRIWRVSLVYNDITYLLLIWRKQLIFGDSTSSSGSGVPWSGHVVKWYCRIWRVSLVYNDITYLLLIWRKRLIFGTVQVAADLLYRDQATWWRGTVGSDESVLTTKIQHVSLIKAVPIKGILTCFMVYSRIHVNIYSIWSFALRH